MFHFRFQKGGKKTEKRLQFENEKDCIYTDPDRCLHTFTRAPRRREHANTCLIIGK